MKGTTLLTIATVGLLLSSRVMAQVVITIEAPGVQASTVPGITTETFDSVTPGIYTTLNSAIGTYTSPGLAVVSANAFGGAGGTHYFAIGAQSGTLNATLALPSDQGYFGFWFSAGDARNLVQLYENNTLVSTLNTAGLINFINAQPNASSYYGNPNNGQDGGEPFAYVNFFGTDGTVFNKVVFSNGTTSSGFESDNHSIGPASTPTGMVFTPEPGAYALFVSLSLTGVACLRRKRAR